MINTQESLVRKVVDNIADLPKLPGRLFPKIPSAEENADKRDEIMRIRTAAKLGPFVTGYLTEQDIAKMRAEVLSNR